MAVSAKPATPTTPDSPPETDGSSGGAPGRAKWSKRKAKAFLASCPKKPVLIERTNDDVKYETDTGGKPAYQYVGWNGWAYPVPKGRLVEVPEPIAQILEQSRELFRTAQARERRAFFNDIGDSLGVEVSI